MDLGCPSRAEQFPLGGVGPTRPVWACRGGVHPVWRLVDPSSRTSRGSDHGMIWAGVGPAVGTSWGTVVRVGPGFWPGDVACLALVFVVDRCVPGAVTALARW